MEKRKGEWKGGQRLVNGQFKTGPPVRDWRSAEHQAACSTGRVLTGRGTSCPGLGAEPRALQGKKARPSTRQLSAPAAPRIALVQGPGSVNPLLLFPHLRCATGKDGRAKTSQEGRSHVQSWRSVGHETQLEAVPFTPCRWLGRASPDRYEVAVI